MPGEGYLATKRQILTVLGQVGGAPNNVLDPHGLHAVFGRHTTVTAVDTVVTGLSRLLSVMINRETVPVAACERESASIGDQAGSPAAGSFTLSTWNSTNGAATTFSHVFSWMALGVL